ncbi:MAG: hypothetical protein IPK60_09455 [Sandaracinaceae bacterium]|jgi:hypothetical protein|nr:hypothetical protein [Sandaracinaceae bacterium]
MRERSVAIGCALLCALFSGCGGCGSGDVIAKLTQGSGTVDADDAAAGDAWEHADSGHEFHIGDAVRTGATSTASVTLSRGGTIRMRQNSLIRFQRSRRPGGGVQLGLDFGEAVLESGNQAMEFETLFGAARMDSGSTLWIGRAEGENVRFEVQVGSATLEAASGDQTLNAGDSFVVDIGGAIVEEHRDAGITAEAALPVAVDAGTPPEVPDAGPAAPTGAYALVVGGRAARVRTNATAEWQPLAVGETRVDAGAQVAVVSGGTLEVTGTEGSATIRGASQVTIGGANGALVEADRGNVAFNTAGGDVRIQVPGGFIIARGGAGATAGTIEVHGDAGSRVRVQRGEANVRGPNGSATVRAGQSMLVRDANETQAEPTPPAPRDDLAGINAGPTGAKMTIAAGESPTIHDPTAPAVLRVRIGETCSGDAVLELGRNGSFTRPVQALAVGGTASVLVPNGSHRYRVRCATNRTLDAEPRAQGSVRVQRDAGTQQLPRTAPRSTVEADGRRYTVLYQTILPEITFQWPHPAESTAYVLTVTPARGAATTIRSARPNTTVASGRLDEGDYTVAWATADGAHQSRPTTMRIDFDNATPVAFLRSPAAGAAMSGTVHVDGGVQEGATVSVGGQSLPVDSSNRFVGDVPAPTNGECLAIRLSHPQRGVHYYLRCPPGAGP